MSTHLFYLFPFLVLCSSCLTYYTPQRTVSEPIFNIQPPPHQQKVPVYFSYQEVPDRPYIHLGLLETRGREWHTFNELLERLRQLAREGGADALILIRNSDYEKIDWNEWLDEYETLVYREQAAVAIKFEENLDFFDRLVKNHTYYRFHPETRIWTPVAYRQFDLEGNQLVQEGAEEVLRFFSDVSLDSLYYSHHNWKTRKRYGGDVVRVKRDALDRKIVKCWITLLGDQPHVLDIKRWHFGPFGERKTTQAKMQILYDQEANPIEKVVRSKDQKWVFQYTYAEGLLQEVEVVGQNDRESSPLFLMKVGYFTNPEGLEIIRNNQFLVNAN